MSKDVCWSSIEIPTGGSSEIIIWQFYNNRYPQRLFTSLITSTQRIRDWEMLVITMVNSCNIFIASGTCENGHRDNCLNRDNVAGPLRLSPTATLHKIRLKSRNIGRKSTAKNSILSSNINRLTAGGERGIRTLETVARLHAFQACAIDHSATSPKPVTALPFTGARALY